MIIIDYSQVAIANFMAEIGGRKDVELNVSLLRHMIINTIRSYKTKFGGEFGQVVIACDNRHYWRKAVFPHYKANRKKAREESGLDWAMIFDTLNLVKSEIDKVFPYKVVEVEGAEADDVIATLVTWAQTNDLDDSVFDPGPKPIMIVSGDHDFIQLQKYKQVKQFSPIQKKFIKADRPIEYYVREHIIKGDKGDGVPNVLSADDTFVTGARQKPIASKRLEEWIADPASMPRDDNFRRNYDRNQTLVDFTKIPEAISQQIIDRYTQQPTKDRSQLLNYFIENKMRHLFELVNDF